MMRKFIGFAIVSVALLAGCRFKGGESFLSATTPNAPGSFAGDPYGGVGHAEGTGGINAKTRYGLGANQNATAPVNASFDQPAKGVGQQPGEYPHGAASGFGTSNAPANQSQPQDASSITIRNSG